MGHNSQKNRNSKSNDRNREVKIVDVQYSNRKRNAQKKDIYDILDMIKLFLKKNIQSVLAAAVLLSAVVLVVVLNSNDDNNKKDKKVKQTQEVTTLSEKTSEITEETSIEETSAEETQPVLTLTPEAPDSEIVTLISNFYQAYTISGDVNQVGQYIDSVNGMDESRLTINKKYIEQVSDFTCYQSDLDIISDDYTIVIVTYKLKLYNYAELLPSIDILFLANGEAGYKVHNLTVDDTFDKQKIENDSNFQILSNQVASELTALLQNNGELNEVYNLYLNPNATAQ